MEGRRHHVQAAHSAIFARGLRSPRASVQPRAQPAPTAEPPPAPGMLPTGWKSPVATSCSYGTGGGSPDVTAARAPARRWTSAAVVEKAATHPNGSGDRAAVSRQHVVSIPLHRLNSRGRAADEVGVSAEAAVADADGVLGTQAGGHRRHLVVGT